MHPTTKQLLALADQPYENYNANLPKIKEILAEPDRIEAFERVLLEELPLTTARRAYRSAIKIAMGEENVYREWRPAEQLAAKFNIKRS
jgi:hypothetical protein